MQEQLISFETAKLSKEKGFDVPTKHYYEEDGELCQYRNSLKDWNNLDPKKYSDMKSTPTQSLLQKWLRDKHSILVLVNVGDKALLTFQHNRSLQNFNTYEEALEKGLQEALKLINN